MAEDAVQCEPVSAFEFPANREINREFWRIRLSGSILMSNGGAISNEFVPGFAAAASIEGMYNR